MSFEDKIKNAQEIKNQSNQAKQPSTSIRQTINLGNGLPTKYQLNKLGRPTNESYEGDVSGKALNN